MTKTCFFTRSQAIRSETCFTYRLMFKRCRKTALNATLVHLLGGRDPQDRAVGVGGRWEGTEVRSWDSGLSAIILFL